MKNQKNNLGLFVFGATILLSFKASAQSVAQPGHECSEPFRIVTMDCQNPETEHQIRLLVSETQTCRDGNIESLSRNDFGIVLGEQGDMSGDPTTFQYSSKRTHMDDRSGDQTFVLPSSVEIKTSELDYKIKITDKVAPNFDGAFEDESHFVGSFEAKDPKGITQVQGTLNCTIAP